MIPDFLRVSGIFEKIAINQYWHGAVGAKVRGWQQNLLRRCNAVERLVEKRFHHVVEKRLEYVR
jgi:hypothetical protein